MKNQISAWSISILVSILVINGCAIKHNVEVKGKIDPIEVRHTVSIDTTSLHKFFEEQCAITNTNSVDIMKCADDKINKFMEKFT